MQGQSFAPGQPGNGRQHRHHFCTPLPTLLRASSPASSIAMESLLRSSGMAAVAALLSAGLSIFGPAAQLMIAAIDLPTLLFGVLLGFGPRRRDHNGRATLTTRAVPKPPPIATPRWVSSPLPQFSPPSRLLPCMFSRCGLRQMCLPRGLCATCLAADPMPAAACTSWHGSMRSAVPARCAASARSEAQWATTRSRTSSVSGPCCFDRLCFGSCSVHSGVNRIVSRVFARSRGNLCITQDATPISLLRMPACVTTPLRVPVPRFVEAAGFAEALYSGGFR